MVKYTECIRCEEKFMHRLVVLDRVLASCVRMQSSLQAPLGNYARLQSLLRVRELTTCLLSTFADRDALESGLCSRSYVLSSKLGVVRRFLIQIRTVSPGATRTTLKLHESHDSLDY